MKNTVTDPVIRGLGQGESASYPTFVGFVSGSEERIKILPSLQQRSLCVREPNEAVLSFQKCKVVKTFTSQIFLLSW